MNQSSTVPAVRIAGLQQTFDVNGASRHVLDGVDLEIRTGETVCVVGHSGTGKSTLLRCVAGLQRPSGGEVAVAGQAVAGPPDDLAVVFQDYGRSLMPWLRIRENVTLPLRRSLSRQERNARAAEALAAVGLDGVERLYPWQVSGGMQQRVAIARALAYRPQVLLMDEPFASVDAQTRADLEDLVVRIAAESRLTLMVVTHDIDEAVYLGDRVVVLAGKPARIAADLEVDLPPGRDQLTTKADPEFLRLRGEVMSLIRRETASIAEGVSA
ncbi:ABC transporter ATP-binding protein [Aeromicrobium choanae]|uniref:NitT/TauT family transport system ATP-binding protein n=1 Tax=Aeromicrobium choanae TaxID=1736691 RepID=A0A1T4YW82_9ACTN|nr:ABC transporter ATP-binding protein [Aeromicrobium choanae]SKB05986.1 NitT/TauT family transport system ATP-binding protein [Aeromicrobium choanae]